MPRWGALACHAAPGVAPLERWRLHVAYDGTDFIGWQRQSVRRGLRTVQSEVDKALGQVFNTRGPLLCKGASRTDRGVHAKGQVCHFDAPTTWGEDGPGLDAATALTRLRRQLPVGITAVLLGKVQFAFHARLCPLRKYYSYSLALTRVITPFEARFCWCCGPLDVDAMTAAANILDGITLDYSAYTTGKREPHYHGPSTKTVSVAVRHDGEHRCLVLVACDRFLYKMVRRLVGALVEVGRGHLAAESLVRAQKDDFETAPPQGLCLDAVEYEEAEFPTPPLAPGCDKVFGLDPPSWHTVPQMAATISKDFIALWKIGLQGLGLETPCVWKKGEPCGQMDPTVLRHETATRLWASGNNGVVNCFDVEAPPGSERLASIQTKSNGWISGMELWPKAGVMVCSHTSGIAFLDTKAGKLIRQQYTKASVGRVAVLNGDSPMLFAGIGSELLQYDTRVWRDGVDYKPKAVGSWTLRAGITSVHATETNKGHLLVAAGCDDGNLVAFDTT